MSLLKILARSHAADEIRSLRVLMTIDLHESLVGDLRGKDLAESCFSATCLTNEQDRLSVSQAFLNKNSKAFKLLRGNDPW